MVRTTSRRATYAENDDALARAMSKSDRYAAYYSSHMREADGKARRSPDVS